jgi:hypothetical protein
MWAGMSSDEPVLPKVTDKEVKALIAALPRKKEAPSPKPAKMVMKTNNINLELYPKDYVCKGLT